MTETTVKLANTAELETRTAALASSTGKVVQSLADRSLTYVWGYQDGAKEEMDCAEAWNFMAAYWAHVLDFYEEKKPSYHNIARAFEKWRETGEISRN